MRGRGDRLRLGRRRRAPPRGFSAEMERDCAEERRDRLPKCRSRPLKAVMAGFLVRHTTGVLWAWQAVGRDLPVAQARKRPKVPSARVDMAYARMAAGRRPPGSIRRTAVSLLRFRAKVIIVGRVIPRCVTRDEPPVPHARPIQGIVIMISGESRNSGARYSALRNNGPACLS